MSDYREVIWKLAMIIPICLLLWHGVLFIGGLAFSFFIEGLWLILYGLMLGVLLHPSPLGYIYIILLIIANSGWEIYIGYLTMNELYILRYLLPSLGLLYLYINHKRFQVSKPVGVVAVVALCTLLLEAGCFYFKINHFKANGEYGQWIEQSYEYDVNNITEPAWRDNDTLITQFVIGRENNLPIYALGELNINSGELQIIDGDGFNPVVSNDGNWLSYEKKTDGNDKDHKIFDYVRCNMSTGEKETLLRYMTSGYNFTHYMAPSGDKLAFFERQSNPIQVFPTKDPEWPVFKWHDWEKNIWYAVWLPDGSSVLVQQGAGLSIYSPKGQLSTNIPSTGMGSKYIFSFKMSLDGRCIYLYQMQTKGIYLYDIQVPDAGWREIGEKGTINYAVGPDGLLVYNYLDEAPDVYTYLHGRILSSQGLWVYRPGMTEPVRITSSADKVLGIAPDGKTIAFVRHGYKTWWESLLSWVSTGEKLIFIRQNDRR